MVKEALVGAQQLIFECAGAEGMLSKVLLHVAQFGRIISLGFCTAPDSLIPAMGSYKCASIQFAVGYSTREFIYIAEQTGKGHVDPKAIITRDIALNELPGESYASIPIRLLDTPLRQAMELSRNLNIYAYDAYVIACATNQRAPLLSLDRSLVERARSLKLDILEVTGS